MGYFTDKPLGGWPHLMRRLNALEANARYHYTASNFVTAAPGTYGILVAASADYIYTAERQSSAPTNRYIRQYDYDGVLIKTIDVHQANNPSWPIYTNDDGGYVSQITALTYDHENDLLLAACRGPLAGFISGDYRIHRRIHAWDADLNWQWRTGQYPATGAISADGDMMLIGDLCSGGGSIYVSDRAINPGDPVANGYLHKFDAADGAYDTRHTFQYTQIAYDAETDEIAAALYFAAGATPADAIHVFDTDGAEVRSFGGSSGYTVCPEAEAQFPAGAGYLDIRDGELYTNDGARLQVVNLANGLYIRRGIPGIPGTIAAPPDSVHVWNANENDVAGAAALLYKLTETNTPTAQNTWHRWINADNPDGYEKQELGTPDAGATTPALDAFEGPNVRIDIGTLIEMRLALESQATRYRKAGACDQMNWLAADPNNLYSLAVDRTLYGCSTATGYDWLHEADEDLIGTPCYDIQIGEIHEIIKYLETCTLYDA